jgi:phage terminase Nu1 subunit (DNA packaging protein)
MKTGMVGTGTVSRGFRVSIQTVHRWANVLDLPCVSRRDSDERLFDPDEVEAWARKTGRELDPRWPNV